MGAGFALPRFPQQRVPVCTCWKQFGFIAQTPCFSGETFFKGLHLLDAPAFHGAPPSLTALQKFNPRSGISSVR
jgi:hypothetical protein